ncbi:hypothetical protein LUZ62_021326 [Rhynchospora pubera]|uniref:Uncharacterized protein n=1 Tax=Rhynchospora pubera TaxID=906938 RepID=A0AAV8GSX7_9POAL|nr:hypothetical protein LUZ62_021326 [Rhynchospora pubera]
MLRSLSRRASPLPTSLLSHLTHQRAIHDRNKKAMELVAKGWSALQEVDRVIDYADRNDTRLIPLLRGAKENFELALEVDNMNTHARYWLARMHFKYHVPGACKAIGAALLIEAANMGDADAQYELGCKLRVDNEHVQSDQQAFYYLEKAVDQLHPGALYLLGAVYLAGDCVKKDVTSAMWCFHRASEKGHAGAAIACGSLLLKGVEIPEVITRFSTTGKLRKKGGNIKQDFLKLAKEKFQIAAEAGNDLGFRWLKHLSDGEKGVQTKINGMEFDRSERHGLVME